MDETPNLSSIPQQPINGQPSGLKPDVSSIKKATIWGIATVGLIITGLLIAVFVWYNVQMTPRVGDSKQLVVVAIEPGVRINTIGQLLEEKGVIRSGLAFEVYSRLSGTQDNLQAGTYRLSPADSTPQIVEHLKRGNVDTFNITFYPGSTLVDNTNKPESEKIDVSSVLKRAGYTDNEITAGLSATYDSPLFEGKTASTDLEGYVYGETYNFNNGASVETILQRTFDEYYAVIKDNNLVDAFKSHGLSLYEGITLASIIQREVSSPADQKQAAQVFFKRLDFGMQLGSDVTYQYIADKLGVVRDPSFDNPYNTRIHIGLPPGPISNPGLSALLAVASPSSGDYLYFLSGDDGITYFATTEEGHTANIRDHCQRNCSSL